MLCHVSAGQGLCQFKIRRSNTTNTLVKYHKYIGQIQLQIQIRGKPKWSNTDTNTNTDAQIQLQIQIRICICIWFNYDFKYVFGPNPGYNLPSNIL